MKHAIGGFIADFTIQVVERACPMVGRDLIRMMLGELRVAGMIEPVGKGRGAKWRNTGKK